MQANYKRVKAINDLVYNEPTHLVSVFKDYLIMDDINEFLKRPYTNDEQKVRLPKFCHFYEQMAPVIVPNYIGSMPEAHFMFKNLERK